MELHIKEMLFHGKRCYRCVAKIGKSKKLGIHSSRQKTWKIYPTHASFGKPDLKDMFRHEAERWRMTIMHEMFPAGVPEKSLTQIEINDTTNTQQHNTKETQ